MSFKVFRFEREAKLPVRKHEGDAGYDLASAEAGSINPGDRKLVSTGLCFSVNSDNFVRIYSRSGLSCSGIDVGAGVVDSSYTGVVKVLLINNSKNVFHYNVGDRIAQAVIHKIETPQVQEVDSVDDLGTTDRGAGGFGSTGI